MTKTPAPPEPTPQAPPPPPAKAARARKPRQRKAKPPKAAKRGAYPHVDALLAYCRDVVGGTVPAAKLTILACQRHLDDLERVGKKDWPYYFDNAAAERICRFAELLPHVKGVWAKRHENISLEAWQCFALGVPFGWKKFTRHGVRAPGDRRRFREIYDEIPRKNGKSILGAIIGNYMTIGDGEHGAEVYSGATTEKQAWEVFGPARLMLKNSPDLCEEAGLTVNAKSLVKEEDNSRFLPVIGNPGDGSSPHCSIIDEYHEHQTSNQYDTMITGMGARAQPMAVIITTAGSSMAGPCYDKRIEARKVLEGVIKNEELFALIYTIDDADDWADPAVLQKANPNYGVSVDPEFLLSQQRQAVLNAQYQNRFRTKHLNVWCSAKSAWMNMQEWQACADPGLTLEDFTKDECLLILDLASRNDICVLMLLFVRMLAGQRHYYALGRYYLPEDTVEAPGPNQSIYRAWVAKGLLTATDGAEIDFDFIKDEVVALSSKTKVKEIAYDPWRAVHLAQLLTKNGATCVEYRQIVQTMSLPMKELLSAVKSGRFHHNGDPVLTWMASNVVAKEDAKENIYPRKEKQEMKIDGIVAIIMGIGRAQSAVASPKKFQMFFV